MENLIAFSMIQYSADPGHQSILYSQLFNCDTSNVEVFWLPADRPGSLVWEEIGRLEEGRRLVVREAGRRTEVNG
jgi:hypothetical protein